MARNRKENDYPVKKRKSPMRVIAGWIIFIGVFLALIFALVPLVGATMKVTDGAMGPSLAIGDTVAVNHISYLLLRPKRGDVIQFVVAEEDQAAASQTKTVYLRRVIGRPGETVQIMDGKVYINGYPLEEEYAAGAASYAGIAASQVTLDNDEYFVMADNRSNNFDSRDATVGPISRDDILGKVWIRVLPFEKFGFVK